MGAVAVSTAAEQEAERRYPREAFNDAERVTQMDVARQVFVAGAGWAWENPPDHIRELLEAARELQTTDDTGLWCFMCDEMVMVCTCAGGMLRAAAAALNEE